ncbi:hypothetical protein GL50803_0014621 [Giardia duodenalis]|uniref:Uncharacterized protein n=1 Tax=Giardia intestinalis (strain ATCC 50803 / WB clone C6) TaxID=184922 RepID=A8B6M4_GIAIC|nr:hypothetical protein GL50803_0014621 [Giardia intestinalis]KAE8301889.1 hypothetical protein GL50803_0014621 [Giardia intestinalis]|eukprot:XP_001709015.1 Hypothetical protein GL50803_14621 [Giardia lamblia ATCC 50803]
MAFSPGKTVDCYLAEGWRVLPPTRAVCRTCGTALLWHKSYPFTYCVDCAEKVTLCEGTTSPPVDNAGATQKTSLLHESCDSKEAQRASSPSALLGSLLLRGYTMSALSCPRGCNIPLARKPSDHSVVLCASCGFQSSDAAFAEPQSRINSEELAHQIAQKVKLIASQPSMKGDDSQGGVVDQAERKEETDISIAYLAEALKDRLVCLGKQLAEAPLDSFTPNIQQRVTSLVSAMRDIQDARRMLLESLAS